MKPVPTTESDHRKAPMTTSERLQVVIDGSAHAVPSARFGTLVLDRGIGHLASFNWPTTATEIDPVLPYALVTASDQHAEVALLDLQALFGSECFAELRLSQGSLRVTAAASERVLLPEIRAWLQGCFPQAVASTVTEVPIGFWAYGAHGACSTHRSIAVPPWQEIIDNYPAAVRDQLATLLADDFRPSTGGQLLLWYGPPGTGKTHALRALAWEWRAWCDVRYVVDPEVLFAERADYLLEVVLDEDSDERWNLLVLEDTGELLAVDAKQRTGQGLSRLLNLVDGLVGQGLRVLVLVTTNEPLQRLHPAVSRPGRCASRIEFGPFPAGEADAWLAARGAEGAGQAATLADLYARVRGEVVETRQPIGFTA